LFIEGSHTTKNTASGNLGLNTTLESFTSALILGYNVGQKDCKLSSNKYIENIQAVDKLPPSPNKKVSQLMLFLTFSPKAWAALGTHPFSKQNNWVNSAAYVVPKII
jgi:hypothetical protein